MRNKNEFTIDGEYLFEVDLMTKHSVTPMTVEVSKLDIDRVSFMLVRLFDTDGDIVEQFTDVISTMPKAVEWVNGLGLEEFDLALLMEGFREKAKEFYDAFMFMSFFDNDFDY